MLHKSPYHKALSHLTSHISHDAICHTNSFPGSAESFLVVNLILLLVVTVQYKRGKCLVPSQTESHADASVRKLPQMLAPSTRSSFKKRKNRGYHMMFFLLCCHVYSSFSSTWGWCICICVSWGSVHYA